MTAEGKVSQPHILYIVEPAAYLLYGPFCNCRLVRLQNKLLKESIQRGYAHIHKLRNCLPPYLHISCLLPQPASLTLTAHCLAGIAGQHILVLYLVAHALHHLKERCNSGKQAVALPKELLLFFCKLSIRFMYRKIKLMGTHYELLEELAHSVTPPAGNCPLINGKGCIWDHQVLVYSYHAAVTSTYRTRTYRVIVAEHKFCRLLKADTVCLK